MTERENLKSISMLPRVTGRYRWGGGESDHGPHPVYQWDLPPPPAGSMYVCMYNAFTTCASFRAYVLFFACHTNSVFIVASYKCLLHRVV